MLPGTKVTVFVPTTTFVPAGKFVVATTVVSKLESIWIAHTLVGRIKKSPKTPLTRDILVFVASVGNVPAGDKGELVRDRLTVPPSPRGEKLLVTRLAKVCWNNARKFVV